jgi:hypothetical protein
MTIAWSARRVAGPALVYALRMNMCAGDGAYSAAICRGAGGGLARSAASCA